MIEIKELFLAFTKEYDALHNINLEIKDGEKIALVGEADSGKTMLLRVLAKLENFKSGEIYVNGIDLKKVDFKQDISVGFVPKSFLFFDKKTIKENFEYVLKQRKFDPATINLKVLTALKNFDIENIQNIKVKDLSPYQKALAELARVSMRKVDLFLIDDICAGLVPSECKKLVEKIKEMINDNPKSTFIIATTDEKIAQELELKIVYLKHGCIDNQE